MANLNLPTNTAARRWKLPDPWLGVFRRRGTPVFFAVMCVAILLATSAPQSWTSNSKKSTNSFPWLPPSVPPAPYIPYLVNASEFPLPDVLLNNSSGVYDPQFVTTVFQNQTIYELAYGQITPPAQGLAVTNMIQFLDGRYDPTEAICQLNRTSCGGNLSLHLPIYWGSPWNVFSLGSHATIQGVALGSSGGLVATAFSSGNSTRMLFTYNLGQSLAWTNPTPTPIPGIQPKLSVSPTAISLTTVSASGGVYVTVFHLPNLPPSTPPSSGGGGRFTISAPVVTSVAPYYGPVGSTIDIYGTNFASGASVRFGLVPSSSVTFVSSTHLRAVVTGPTSSTPVNVTVTTSAGTSTNDLPYDWFEISGTPPQPRVLSIVPNNALPNSTVTVVGFGFAGGQTVKFGSAPALGSSFVNETYFTATVPWGAGGPVDLQVIALGQSSVILPTDHFTFAVSQSVLPRAVDASPLQLSNGATGAPVFGVFASDANSSKTKLYNSTNGGGSYSGTSLAGFSSSTGSSIFTQIGGTRLFLGGGTSGGVASVGFGQTIFGLFTSNLGNRTVVETEGSSDGGQTWNGPYYTAPLLGSIRSPYATISPAGLVYVTWLDNGAGPWQVDQAVFSESGRLLLGPQIIPGSGGQSGNSALSPTVAVDGLNRPLYVWGWTNGPACSPCLSLNPANVSILATGAYINATNAAAELSNAFHRTVPTDFVPSDFLWATSQAQNLTPFQNKVNARIAWVQANLSAAKPTCTIQKLALRYVLPNISYLRASAPFYGVNGHCSTSPTAPVTQIANLSGPTSANTYLGIYGYWLLESLGYGSLNEPNWPGAPDQSQLQRNYHLVPPPLHLPPDQSANKTGANWHVLVTPLSLNPNSIYLNVTGYFSTIQAGGSNYCDPYRQHRISDYWYDYPTWANETVRVQQLIGGSYSHTFSAPGWMPSPYITGLPSGFWGTYNISLSVTYQEFQTKYDGCNNASAYNFQHQPVHPFTLSPHYVNLSLAGNMTTYLEGVPADFTVHEVGNTTGANATVYEAWNNSVLANYSEWTNGTGLSKRITTYSVATPETTGPISLATNKWYNATANLVSVPGGYNASGWSPILATGLSGNSSSERFNATSPWTCAYHLPTANPVHIYSDVHAVSGVTTSNVTLTWWSNYDGSGWVSYNDSDDGVFTMPAQKVNLTLYGHSGLVPNASAPIMYRVQLHGLTQWALYRATIGVSGNGTGTFSGGGSCLTFTTTARWHFHTLSLFTMQEQDFPYDSIAQQGGGAQFRWSIPMAFSKAATYHNGTMSYCQWWTNRTPAQCGPGTNITVPLPTLNAELAGSRLALTQINSSFVLNTTGLALNTQYNATLLLNFTYLGVQFNASSRPLVFWYEKDTSGDGLTDWEKIHGWEVSTQSATGSWNTPTWATANPNLFATNGLVNDFVEKEFGLNPSTVDTAGSHMLDTWNLTFDLGGKGHPLRIPSNANFQFWYEAGNLSTDYNPAKTCQYFVTAGTSCTEGKSGTNLTNLSGSDSSIWASRVFWNKSALWSFLNFSGVRNASWLRAVTGNTTTDWTLTVEGKLSWGANPLATSTPRDGVADGARVNALYDEDLVISSLSANIYNAANKGCPATGGSSNYFGWAPRFYLNYTVGGTSYNELPGATGNFTRQSNDTYNGGTNGRCGSLSNWQVAIPIAGMTQNQSLQAQLLLHYTGSGKDQLWAEKFNATSGTSYKSATISFDTVRSSTNSLHCTTAALCQFAGTNGTLNFTLSVMPAGSKDPTYLWLPNDNGTLSNLPWGLKRYTGEQAFDLLEIDQTSGGSLSINVPYGQNASRNYRLTLPAGLDNILIPRGQFLSSSLGRGILLGANLSWNSSNPSPPLLNSSANTTLSGFGTMTNPLRNLACYWQNRAINTTSGTLLCSTGESSTPWTSPENVASVVSNSSDGANTGGVPGNPGLETSAQAGAAVQSILTLNISSQTELVLLLAGLMDNASGGLNGTFLPVTYQIQSLGLNPVVTSTLANATFPSSGLFAEPTSNWLAPPPPPCSGAFCWASNLVSGIVSVGGTFFSYVWSAATALATFINDHVPTWLKNLGAALLARATAALAAAGQLLKACLAALAQAIIAAVSAFIAPTVTWLSSLSAGLIAGVQAALSIAANSTRGYGDPAAATAFTTGATPIFIGAAVLGAIGTVALTMLVPAEAALGPVGILLMIVLVTLLSSLARQVALPGVGPLPVTPVGLFTSAAPLANLTAAIVGGTHPYAVPRPQTAQCSVPNEQGDIFLAKLVTIGWWGIVLSSASVAMSGLSSAGASFGLSLGLSMLSWIVTAFNAGPNVTINSIHLGMAFWFSAASLIMNLIGLWRLGQMSEVSEFLGPIAIASTVNAGISTGFAVYVNNVLGC